MAIFTATARSLEDEDGTHLVDLIKDLLTDLVNTSVSTQVSIKDIYTQLVILNAVTGEAYNLNITEKDIMSCK